MSVVRIIHQQNYVVLQKEILENMEISLKAKGLWAYCMSKPDKWEFRLKVLESMFKEGRTAISQAMKELIKYGYCLRIQNKDSHGKWTTVDYEIHETSQLKKCLPQTGFPLTEKPRAENQLQVSKEEEVINEESNITPIPPSGRDNPPEKKSKVNSAITAGRKLKFIDHVYLTEIEHKKLLDLYGAAKTELFIKKLDAYIGSKGRKYKSHYKTILSWNLKDETEKMPKQEQKNEPEGNADEWLNTNR